MTQEPRPQPTTTLVRSKHTLTDSDISRGLRALDTFSHSDPLCVLYSKVTQIRSDQWVSQSPLSSRPASDLTGPSWAGQSRWGTPGTRSGSGASTWPTTSTRSRHSGSTSSTWTATPPTWGTTTVWAVLSAPWPRYWLLLITRSVFRQEFYYDFSRLIIAHKSLPGWYQPEVDNNGMFADNILYQPPANTNIPFLGLKDRATLSFI